MTTLLYSIFVLYIKLNLALANNLWMKAILSPEYQNMVEMNGAINILSTATVVRCFSVCINNDKCLSFFFNSNTGQCVMCSNNFFITAPSLAQIGWKYYISKNIKCQYEWGGHCYYFSDDVKNWTDAQKTCLRMGANLVKYDDAMEDAWIVSIIKSLHGEDTWIGATAVGQAVGKWVWASDNSVMTYTNWASGEPTLGSEQCVLVWADIWASAVQKFHWNDAGCENPMYYICEK